MLFQFYNQLKWHCIDSNVCCVISIYSKKVVWIIIICDKISITTKRIHQFPTSLFAKHILQNNNKHLTLILISTVDFDKYNNNYNLNQQMWLIKNKNSVQLTVFTQKVRGVLQTLSTTRSKLKDHHRLLSKWEKSTYFFLVRSGST